MNPLRVAPALVVAMTSPVLVVMLGAASANADTPVGT
jgi:hypothetical protein